MVLELLQLTHELKLPENFPSSCSSIFLFLGGKLCRLRSTVVLKWNSSLCLLGNSSGLNGEVRRKVLLVNVGEEGGGFWTEWMALQVLQNITHSVQGAKNIAGKTAVKLCLTGEQDLCTEVLNMKQKQTNKQTLNIVTE